MFFFLFFLATKVSHLEKYQDICFTIIGENERDVNIKVHPKLPFIPNILRFLFITRENLYDKKLDIIKKDEYYLEKSDHYCSDPFVYEVPWSSQPILTVDMNITWGEEPAILIDRNEVVLRNEFESSVHEFEGLLGLTRLKIYFKHERFSRSLLSSKPNKNSIIQWNTEVRELLPGESYCLAFLTLNFYGMLFFARNPSEPNRTLTYYRFVVEVFDELFYNLYIVKKTYLSHVFPCQRSQSIKYRLKIFVRPRLYSVRFKLIENLNGTVYLAKYLYTMGRFKVDVKNSDFYFTYFEMKPKFISEEVFSIKNAILLYPESRILVESEARIPEVIDKLMVAYKEFIFFGGYKVFIRFHEVDMTTNEFGVYKIRIASMSDQLMFS